MVSATIDIYPQTLAIDVIENVADTYVEKPTQTPVLRGVDTKGGAYVMNIMKIIIEARPPTEVSQQYTKVKWHIADRTLPSVKSMNISGVILNNEQGLESDDPVPTPGKSVLARPDTVRIYDLTDGNGHGLLYGKSTIYMGIKGTATGVINFAYAKIIYTMVKVSAAELLGIIQD